MKFIITVDTEADNQWKRREKITLRNISFLPRFQKLCAKYSFLPTYLTTYEVAGDKKSVEILSKWQNHGQAEIGSHLHPWTTPPFSDEEKKDNTIRTFPNELPDDLLRQKLKNLTDKTEEAFGRQPTSFRAGRWGFDDRVAENLVKLGYLIDCSVSPKVSWQSYPGMSNGKGGPDFRQKQARPHYLNTVGGGKLLEAPMTILYTGLLKKENTWLAKKFLQMPDNFYKKVINRLFFRQKWLRVFSNSTLRDWQGIYQSAALNKLPVLEFMIHSSELMPGGSPYWKTKESVEILYDKLEELFKFLKDKGVKGATLTQFARAFNKLVA